MSCNEDCILSLQEIERALLVEEDKADGQGGNVTEGEDKGTEVGGAQVAAVADFVTVELAVEFPSGKDADKHSAKRQEHHA